MNFDLRHPREQLASIMHRIYHQGLTTLSGGNLSIRDDNGAIVHAHAPALVAFSIARRLPQTNR